MNKIAFLFKEESKRTAYLSNLLEDKYELLNAHSEEEILALLENHYDDISALIVDHPADKKYIKKVFAFIDSKNNYMFTLPVLLLSSLELMVEDDKYLSNFVVGMISEGETARTVLQRIENTIKFSNSASFDDFSNMLKVLPSLVYLKDKQGRYAFCSQHWHHLKTQSIRGLTDYDIRKSRENAEIAVKADRKVIETGEGMNYIIKEDTDEGVDYLQIIKEPLKDEKGEVTGIIAIINNVTDEELLRQELRQKSITDQLTGLYNRVYYEELLEQFKNSITLPLTIVSADCDGLKKINDKYGHAAGDKYICFARDAIKELLPEESYLFRMGGDEFIAIIPNMNSYQAAKLVKDIVKNSKKFKTSHFSLKLSVGSHTISKKNLSVESAVALSDKAMYRMKNKKYKR